MQEVHSAAAEARKASMMIEDIRNDLKAMEQEKEHLTRKVERIEEELRDVPNIQKLLEISTGLRLENHRKDGLTLQMQEQRNVVSFRQKTFLHILADLPI